MCAFKLEEPSSVGVTSKKKKEKIKPVVITENSLVSDATKAVFNTIGELQEQVKLNSWDVDKIAYELSYEMRSQGWDNLEKPLTGRDIQSIINDGWDYFEDCVTIVHETADFAYLYEQLSGYDSESMGYFDSSVYDNIGMCGTSTLPPEEIGRMVIHTGKLGRLCEELLSRYSLEDILGASNCIVYDKFTALSFY